MTYFNSTDAELLATGEYSNYINYADGIWFDQRTGELMTRDRMIWERLTYWYRCYKQIGKVWKFILQKHFHNKIIIKNSKANASTRSRVPEGRPSILWLRRNTDNIIIFCPCVSLLTKFLQNFLFF